MTTRDADRILVMDEGRIVEEGTHQELMEARGLQCEMYSTQAAKFRSEGVKRSHMEDNRARTILSTRRRGDVALKVLVSCQLPGSLIMKVNSSTKVTFFVPTKPPIQSSYVTCWGSPDFA